MSNPHTSLSRPEQNRIAWLKLKLVPGLGNKSILNLLEFFGSPEDILAAGSKRLSEAGIARDKALQALAAKQFSRDPESEWKALKERNIGLICFGDADYPSNLAGIPDPPAVLFVRGTVEPRDLVSIAVVGSRYATPAGIIFTEKICSDLARSGVTVVSGFAVGIDSAAHRGTLKAGGRTLAVLGCGVDVNYPAMNADLGREIVRSGAMLSEFPLGTPPNAGHFPGRNRIISGLSLGVVVVEAAEKSGSLITARYALEQGREVFAVPGMARSMRSKGAHQLIKQGAKLIEDAEDVLEEIRPLIRSSQPSTSPESGGKIQRDASSSFAKRDGEDKGGAETSFSPEEGALLKILDKIPKHIDEIVQESCMPVQRAAAVLLALELKGLVSQLPGKYFICSL